jgi:hypothetical protein
MAIVFNEQFLLFPTDFEININVLAFSQIWKDKVFMSYTHLFETLEANLLEILKKFKNLFTKMGLDLFCTPI